MSISARRMMMAVTAKTGPIPTVCPLPPAANSYSRSIMEFGAVANGTTSDYQAIYQTMQNVAANGGGVVRIPNQQVGVTLGPGAGGLWPPAGVVIRGEGSNSELMIRSSDSNWYGAFKFTNAGSRLENLKITRSSNTTGVCMIVDPCSGTWLYNVTIDGRRDSFANEWHGLLIAGEAPNRIDNFYIVGSTIRRCDFGLLEPSPRTVVISGFTVCGSTFELNHATDLEFNAPDGTFTNVSVKNSQFRNSQSNSPSGGFGVGLANVQQVEIDNCDFLNYPINPIHIEDRSSNVSVTNCTFVNCATSPNINSFRSHIIILGSRTAGGGSSNITITNNVFDTRLTTQTMDCVYIGAGGTGFAPPHDVSVINNKAIITNSSRVVGIYNAYNITSTPNTVTTS